MAFGFSSPKPKSRATFAAPSSPTISTTSTITPPSASAAARPNISSHTPLPNSPTTLHSPAPISPLVPSPQTEPAAPRPRMSTRTSTSGTASTTTINATPKTIRSPVSPSKSPKPRNLPTTSAVQLGRRPPLSLLQRLTSSGSSPKPVASPPAYPRRTVSYTPAPSNHPTSGVPVVGLGLALLEGETRAPAGPGPVVVQVVSYSSDASCSSRFDTVTPGSDDTSDLSRNPAYNFGRPLTKTTSPDPAVVVDESGKLTEKTWSSQLGEGTIKIGMERVKPVLQGQRATAVGNGWQKARGGVIRLESEERLATLDEIRAACGGGGQGVRDHQPHWSLPAQSRSRSIPASQQQYEARPSSPGPRISAAFGTRRSTSHTTPSLGPNSSRASTPVYFLNGVAREGRAPSIQAGPPSPTTSFASINHSVFPSPPSHVSFPSSDMLTPPIDEDDGDKSSSSTPTSPFTRSFTSPRAIGSWTRRAESPPSPRTHSPRTNDHLQGPLPPAISSLPVIAPLSPPFPSPLALEEADGEGWSVAISTSATADSRSDGSVTYLVTLTPPVAGATSSSSDATTRPQSKRISSSSSKRLSAGLGTKSHAFAAVNGASPGGKWTAGSRATMVNLVLPLGGGEVGSGKLTFLNLPREAGGRF